MRNVVPHLSRAMLMALLVLPPGVVAQQAEPEPPRQSQPLSGLVTIESDRQMADNATGMVTATGNVRITYPDQRVIATARQVQYFTRDNIVVLSGDIDVVQTDGHSLRAEQLHYDINQERLLLTPASGEQVVTIYNLNAQQTPALRPAPAR
jgi:lipopolysaccharide export system protein LptA